MNSSLLISVSFKRQLKLMQQQRNRKKYKLQLYPYETGFYTEMRIGNQKEGVLGSFHCSDIKAIS